MSTARTVPRPSLWPSLYKCIIVPCSMDGSWIVVQTQLTTGGNGRLMCSHLFCQNIFLVSRGVVRPLSLTIDDLVFLPHLGCTRVHHIKLECQRKSRFLPEVGNSFDSLRGTTPGSVDSTTIFFTTGGRLSRRSYNSVPFNLLKGFTTWWPEKTGLPLA